VKVPGFVLHKCRGNVKKAIESVIAYEKRKAKRAAKQDSSRQMKEEIKKEPSQNSAIGESNPVNLPPNQRRNSKFNKAPSKQDLDNGKRNGGVALRNLLREQEVERVIITKIQEIPIISRDL